MSNTVTIIITKCYNNNKKKLSKLVVENDHPGDTSFEAGF